jgi:hypothetical protein
MTCRKSFERALVMRDLLQKLSKTTICSPAFKSSTQVCEPVYPAPPVTKIIPGPLQGTLFTVHGAMPDPGGKLLDLSTMPLMRNRIR